MIAVPKAITAPTSIMPPNTITITNQFYWYAKPNPKMIVTTIAVQVIIVFLQSALGVVSGILLSPID